MVFEPEYEAVLRQRAKVQIRKRMRALRASIPESARAERSRSIVERVAGSDEWKRASTIGMFWPMLEKNEVDVRPLDELAHEQGKDVCYPAIDTVSETMTLRRCASALLVDLAHGFLEPPESASEATIDGGLLILVPALAVDGVGHRVGYGRGFYDRLLARVAPPACALAVAYDFQLVAEVPTEANDVAVACVITDTRTLRKA